MGKRNSGEPILTGFALPELERTSRGKAAGSAASRVQVACSERLGTSANRHGRLPRSAAPRVPASATASAWLAPGLELSFPIFCNLSPLSPVYTSVLSVLGQEDSCPRL